MVLCSPSKPSSPPAFSRTRARGPDPLVVQRCFSIRRCSSAATRAVISGTMMSTCSIRSLSRRPSRDSRLCSRLSSPCLTNRMTSCRFPQTLLLGWHGYLLVVVLPVPCFAITVKHNLNAPYGKALTENTRVSRTFRGRGETGARRGFVRDGITVKVSASAFGETWRRRQFPLIQTVGGQEDRHLH